MAALRIAVVWCAVAALGVGAWNVPRIPSGRRTQFYLLKEDNAYQYGYDTGDGQSAQASADAGNEVRGQYDYVAADGRAIGVRYSAGQGGYVPTVHGVEVPGAQAAAAAAAYAGVRSGAGAAFAAGSSAAEQDPDFDPNADASYSFNIDTDSYKRTEQSDARGNVRGQYSYNSAKGGSHALSYVAGEGTGFVVTGGSASAAAGAAASGATAAGAASAYSGPLSNAQGSSGADGSYSFSFGTNEQSRQESADAQNNVRGSYSFRAKDDGKTRRVDYVAGAATGFVARGDHLPVAPEVPAVPSARIPAFPAPASAASPYSGPLADIQSSAGDDGSYSFAFGTDLQSRQESADAKNNVRGSYSFRAKDDGKTRRVDYVAGAATGFVATGDHLPVAPSVGAPAAGVPAIPSFYSAPAIPSVIPYSGPASNAEGSANADGSYSFSFNTNEQSRQESSDAKNNVRGSYSFRAKDDGKTRRVNYVAGAATGFVASGDHLPVAPEVPSAADVTISSYSAPVIPAAPAFPAPTTSYSGAAADAQGSSGVDGSYSFSFNTKEQSRQESADSRNNVRGSFSFTAPDDGQTRRVDYEAGSATGFVAKGAHLPVAPVVPAVPGVISGPAVSVYSAPVSPVIPATPYSGPASNAQGSANADGSYSFSFSSNEQSRQESADAKNNVRGSYSFKAKDDGKTRRVDYVAGAATGFVASGDHLPKASPAPGSPVAAVAAARLSSAAATSASSPNADGSYSFSYNAADHSRQEAADAGGNVRGSFSFVAKDDGQARRVDYSAGAATGFVASGAHLPVAGAGAGAGTGAGEGAGAGGAGVISSYSAASSGADGDAASGDASYSYSYQTDSSSKSESSDAQGNVRGEFSYVGGDGATRKVSYTSRNKEGFVASGDLGPAGAAADAGAGAVSAAASVVSARAGAGVGDDTRGVHGPYGIHDAHGALSVRTGGALVNQYLPPQSAHKYGYIYDTKA